MSNTMTVTMNPNSFGQQPNFMQPVNATHQQKSTFQNSSLPPQPSVDPQWIASFPAPAPGYTPRSGNYLPTSNITPASYGAQNNAKFPTTMPQNTGTFLPSTPPRTSAVSPSCAAMSGMLGAGVTWNEAAVRPPALRRIGEPQSTPNSQRQIQPAQVFGDNIGSVDPSVYIHPMSPGGSIGVELGMPIRSPTLPSRGFEGIGGMLAGVGRPVLGSVDQNAQYGYAVQNPQLDVNANPQKGDWATWLNDQAGQAGTAAQTGVRSAWRFAGNMYAKVRGVQNPQPTDMKNYVVGGAAGDGMDNLMNSMPSMGSMSVDHLSTTPTASFNGIRVDSQPIHDEETGEADFAYVGYGQR